MFKQLMNVSRGFRLVHIGLAMVAIAIVGIIFSTFLIFAAGAGLVGGAGRGALGLGLFGVVLTWVMYLTFAAGSIVCLVGMIFCIAIPEKAGNAKLLITLSIVLALSAVGLGSFCQLARLLHFSLAPALLVTGLLGWGLFEMAACVLFLLFTKSVARFVRRLDLAGKAMSVLWLYVIAAGLYLFGGLLTVILVIAGAAGGAAGGDPKAAAGGALAGVCLGFLVVGVGLLCGLVGLIRLIVLMKEMQEVVANYAMNNRLTQRSKRKRERVEQAYEYEDDDAVEDYEEEEADVEVAEDEKPQNPPKEKKWWEG
jgi:hypothetical protein